MRQGLRRITACAALAAAVSVAACGATDSSMVEIQRAKAGDLDIVLLSEDGALNQGNETFVIEFRKPDGTLQDAGTVTTSANMSMPGMTMPGNVQVAPADVPGRYRATGNFGMAGGWRMQIGWNGPAGQGSVTVDGTVQ
jgi:hypothetical protein